MRVSARADYALRACMELTRAGDLGSTSEAVAEAQDIPRPFLKNILGELVRAGFVRSKRRRGGGYWLALPAARISVADVLRAMDGPLICVHQMDLDDIRYPASAEALGTLWTSLRADVTRTLEHVSIADLAAGRMPVPSAPAAGRGGLGAPGALTA